jgi:hypothetical protein
MASIDMYCSVSVGEVFSGEASTGPAPPDEGVFIRSPNDIAASAEVADPRIYDSVIGLVFRVVRNERDRAVEHDLPFDQRMSERTIVGFGR